MEKTIVLYIFLLFSFLCQSQDKIKVEEAIVFKDTLNNFVYDSISNNLGKIPFSYESSRLVKHFKYIGKDKIYILKAWAQDPHYICDYPTDILIPNKIYSYTICFYNNGRSGKTQKSMGFNFSDNGSVSFKFFGQYKEPTERNVSGKITDISGNPLIEVSVISEYARKETKSDATGSYTLNAKQSDFLVFNYPGKQSQKIRADNDKIDVVLKRNDYVSQRLFSTDNSVINKIRTLVNSSRDTISVEDLKNINNPKYNFEKNAKNNVFYIFVFGAYREDTRDSIFQEKFNIKYLRFEDNNVYSKNDNYEYFKNYNLLTFKYLNKTFKEVWQTYIRLDAVGLKEFVK